MTALTIFLNLNKYFSVTRNLLMAATKTSLLQLAETIEEDIRKRRLGPGDGYRTTTDTARMLGVNTSRANQALQLLANRKVIQRRQRVGAVIGPAVGDSGKSAIRRIHLVVAEDYLRQEGLLTDGILMGLQRRLPGAELRYNYLPGVNEVEYAEGLLTEAMKNRGTDGFVLFRSSMAVQRVFSKGGMPTVVNGVLQPSVEDVGQIDRDQCLIGKALTEYVVSEGATKILVLLRDRVAVGDSLLLDGIFAKAQEFGVQPSDIMIRWLPPDGDAVAACLEDAMESGAVHGIICRSGALAEQVQPFLKRRRRFKGIVAAGDVYSKGPAQASFAWARSGEGAEEIGEKIAEMLMNQMEGEAAKMQRMTVPIELVRPKGRRK